MKIIILSLIIITSAVTAQINISKTIIVDENFNNLGTAANAVLPANWKADKVSTVRKVGNYFTAGTSTNYSAGINLSSSAGNGIYNYGIGDVSNSINRAVGGLSSGSGSQSVNIYAFFKNTGTTKISQLDLSYVVMRFRNGSNSSGFSIQLHYSKDGINWTNAGPNFLSSFIPNSDNNGAVTVPIESKIILNQTLPNLNVNPNDSLFLAWNYSVTTGNTTSSAQALGIDNFVMNNIGGSTSAPLPPVAASAINISKNGFTANWNSTVSATKYWLDISTNSNFSSFVDGFNNKEIGNYISTSVIGLNPATKYYYRLRASNEFGTSGNSNIIEVLTSSLITFVQFTGSCDAVSKTNGSYQLELSIIDPSLTSSTTCSVVFIADSSSASSTYINNFSSQTISFSAGSSINQKISISIFNDGISEIPKKAFFQIQNVNGGNFATVGSVSNFRLTITSGIDNSYYSNISSSLRGENLKSALHDLIKNQIKFPYTDSNPNNIDVWKMLKAADEDPKNYKNVIGIYSGLSIPKDPQDFWNREHIWSKSHGNFGTEIGAGSDAHNLRPENPSVNSLKGNLDFDIGGNPVPGAPNCKYDSDSWEPRNEVKGDVARTIFYMATRYAGDSGEPKLRIVDYIPSAPNNDSLYAKLSTLLKWNLDDPPDAFEINRNNVIYFYQHNRNPFIDHPEWITYIWGNPPTSVKEKIKKKEDEFNLEQNYPNPFNGETVITYQLASPSTSRSGLTVNSFVELKVFDVLGRLLKTLVNEPQSVGIHSSKFIIQNSELPSGVYYYQLRAGDYMQVRKMVLLK